MSDNSPGKSKQLAWNYDKLNAEVDRLVMGGTGQNPPDYSRDIALALSALNRLADNPLNHCAYTIDRAVECYWVQVTVRNKKSVPDISESFAVAVCLAALQAAMIIAEEKDNDR